jgi:hypothetical protein
MTRSVRPEACAAEARLVRRYQISVCAYLSTKVRAADTGKRGCAARSRSVFHLSSKTIQRSGFSACVRVTA